MTRKPLQGVTNIIRFNWHFYVIALIVIITILFFRRFLSHDLSSLIDLVLSLAVLSILVSLAVSYYIYDHSNIYSLKFLDALNITSDKNLVNINAGFDEISHLLKAKYPEAPLTVLDFYDPEKHTEVSIERARKAYPPYPGTVTIETNKVPLTDNSVDYIFLILAAHEIRSNEERVQFFKQIADSLTTGGRIIVLEHQRDFFNFIAYNFGYFHFLSTETWHCTFKNSGLLVESASKLTPFLKLFILKKNGTSS
ncbi:MAG: class I SAM-dependent methyltransferase [Ignavibacteria bacterium]